MSTWSYVGTYTGSTANIGAGTAVAVGVSRQGALPEAGTYAITEVSCTFSAIRFGGNSGGGSNEYHKYLLLNLPVGVSAISEFPSVPVAEFTVPTDSAQTGIEFTISSSVENEMSLTASDYRDVTSVGLFRMNTGSVACGLIQGCVVTLTVTYVLNAPVYTACSAPASVSASNAAPLPGAHATISWSGARGGTNNPVSGYDLYRATGADGTYALLQAGLTAESATVTAPGGSGQSYFYKVKAKGAAGSGYDSALSTARAQITAYAAPTAPTVLLPASGASAKSAAVRVKLLLAAAPNGGGLTLYRRLDSDAYVSLGAVSAGAHYDALTLAAGAHTLRYKLFDSRGCASGESAVSVTVEAVLWRRAIAAGTVIASEQVSHQADITQMLEQVNGLRAYAGLAAISLPGAPGRFSDWRGQMTALQRGIDAARAALGLGAFGFAPAPGYPTAAVVNEIRCAVSGAIVIDPDAPEPPDPRAETVCGITDELGNAITDELDYIITYE